MTLPGVILTAILALQPAPYEAVLAKLDAYLADYESTLSTLIADEEMAQELRYPNAYAPRWEAPGQGFMKRRLDSEVAFIALPGGAGWMGFRHVKSVDRRAVEDAQLATALSGGSLDSAKALLEASASHNLGLRRNTNLPNLPLEFLHRRNRHRLVARADGREHVRGVDAVRLVFHERMTPTLIKHPEGTDEPSLIRAWIDPKDGRLLRAEVVTFTSFSAERSDHSLRVEFEHDRTLGLLVPKQMREEFPDHGGKGKSTAVYSNYRRFTTSARIVPQ